jgi:hypothetical protein
MTKACVIPGIEPQSKSSGSHHHAWRASDGAISKAAAPTTPPTSGTHEIDFRCIRRTKARQLPAMMTIETSPRVAARTMRNTRASLRLEPISVGKYMIRANPANLSTPTDHSALESKDSVNNGSPSCPTNTSCPSTVRTVSRPDTSAANSRITSCIRSNPRYSLR